MLLDKGTKPKTKPNQEKVILVSKQNGKYYSFLR